MSKNVGLTISDIMALPALKEARLLSGARNLDRRVLLLNIMADPEILDWIDQGQMLAMTGYILPGLSQEERLDFFRTCVDRGVVAVAIKLKPYLDTLDQEILDWLETAGLPVIEVPPEVPVAQLNAEITNALFTKQSHIIERFENIHQQFMDIILSGGGPPDIVNSLADYINNPVVFEVSYSRELITNWRSLTEADQDLIRADYERFRTDRVRRNERRITEEEFLRDGRRVRRKTIPIVLRDNIFGYLTSWTYASELNNYDLSIMEVASTVLSLIIMQSLSVREVDVKFASEFYEDLIADDPLKRQRTMESHSYFDYRSNPRFSVLLAQLRPLDGFVEENINLAVRRLIHFLTPELEQLRYVYELDGIIATRGSSLQILLGFSQGDVYRKVMDKLMEIIRRITHLHFPGFVLDLGVGSLKDSYQIIRDSHREAVHALGIYSRSRDPHMVYYEDLGVYRLLFHEGREQEIEDFARSILGPLENYDDRMKTQLFETLEAYFKTGGNLMEMSRELFLHYNSVLYRLNRIREITGVDLEDEDQKLNLAIALKIRKLVNHKDPEEGIQ